MPVHMCENCERIFKQKGHLESHKKRKNPCKKDDIIEKIVENKVKEIIQTKLDTVQLSNKTRTGLFYIRTYESLKEYIDNQLNKDLSLFKTPNDEPTPTGCLEEMFTKVPCEFWKQKGMKILDPCCGNGNFGFVVAEHLRSNGYSNTEIQKSLYFNDTNEPRLANVKDIFGESINISSFDFLEHNYTESFDMVVMNPPYAKLMPDGRRASKNHNLFIPFMEKGLSILKENGMLVAIVPDSWMSLSDRNKFCKHITQYQFHCLNIHSAKQWFPKVGSSFTWFVVQKTLSSKSFEVMGQWKRTQYSKTVDSQIRSFIPLLYSSIVQQVFKKTIENDSLPKYKVETSSNLHKYTQRNYIQPEETPEYCYRLIHTPKQTVWANRPHKFQDGWKVFISTTDKYSTFPDKCGMTQSIAFIRTDTEDESKDIAEKLKHPLYVFLNNVCRYGNFNNVRILQKFPVSNTKNPYLEFGITSEEVSYIDSHL